MRVLCVFRQKKGDYKILVKCEVCYVDIRLCTIIIIPSTCNMIGI